MKLHFVRHDESTAHLLAVFAYSESTHALTENGVEQTHAVVRSLSGLRVACIYSSPLLRAVQTAQILDASLQAPLEVSEGLREWSVDIDEATADPVG